MAHIYVAPWVFDPAEEVWSAPSKETLIGLIDLRGIRDHVLGTGCGLFVYESVLPDRIKRQKHSGIYLGTSVDTPLAGSVVSSVMALLSRPVANAPTFTVTELLLYLLGHSSDPLGEKCPKTIIPGRCGDIENHLGGIGCIHKEKVDITTHALGPKIITVLQHEYVRQRALDLVSGEESYKRLLTDLSEKYKADYRTFIPGGLRDEGTKPKKTSFGDTFARADSADINASSSGKTKNGSAASWNWEGVELTTYWSIVSNTLQRAVTTHPGNLTIRIADDLLSSPDQKGSAKLNRAVVGANTAHYAQFGPVCRCADIDNFYFGMRQWQNTLGTDGSYARIVTRKSVANVRSDIATAIKKAVAVGEVLGLEVDGSTVKLYYNGGLEQTVTDTSITSGLSCGIYLYATHDVTKIRVTDFHAEDILTSRPYSLVQDSGASVSKAHGSTADGLAGISSLCLSSHDGRASLSSGFYGIQDGAAAASSELRNFCDVQSRVSSVFTGTGDGALRISSPLGAVFDALAPVSSSWLISQDGGTQASMSMAIRHDARAPVSLSRRVSQDARASVSLPVVIFQDTVAPVSTPVVVFQDARAAIAEQVGYLILMDAVASVSRGVSVTHDARGAVSRVVGVVQDCRGRVSSSLRVFHDARAAVSVISGYVVRMDAVAGISEAFAGVCDASAAISRRVDGRHDAAARSSMFWLLSQDARAAISEGVAYRVGMDGVARISSALTHDWDLVARVSRGYGIAQDSAAGIGVLYAITQDGRAHVIEIDFEQIARIVLQESSGGVWTVLPSSGCTWVSLVSDGQLRKILESESKIIIERKGV